MRSLVDTVCGLTLLLMAAMSVLVYSSFVTPHMCSFKSFLGVDTGRSNSELVQNSGSFVLSKTRLGRRGYVHPRHILRHRLRFHRCRSFHPTPITSIQHICRRDHGSKAVRGRPIHVGELDKRRCPQPRRRTQRRRQLGTRATNVVRLPVSCVYGRAFRFAPAARCGAFHRWQGKTRINCMGIARRYYRFVGCPARPFCVQGHAMDYAGFLKALGEVSREPVRAPSRQKVACVAYEKLTYDFPECSVDELVALQAEIEERSAVTPVERSVQLLGKRFPVCVRLVDGVAYCVQKQGGEGARDAERVREAGHSVLAHLLLKQLKQLFVVGDGTFRNVLTQFVRTAPAGESEARAAAAMHNEPFFSISNTPGDDEAEETRAVELDADDFDFSSGGDGADEVDSIARHLIERAAALEQQHSEPSKLDDVEVLADAAQQYAARLQYEHFAPSGAWERLGLTQLLLQLAGLCMLHVRKRQMGDAPPERVAQRVLGDAASSILVAIVYLLRDRMINNGEAATVLPRLCSVLLAKATRSPTSEQLLLTLLSSLISVDSVGGKRARHDSELKRAVVAAVRSDDVLAAVAEWLHQIVQFGDTLSEDELSEASERALPPQLLAIVQLLAAFAEHCGEVTNDLASQLLRSAVIKHYCKLYVRYAARQRPFLASAVHGGCDGHLQHGADFLLLCAARSCDIFAFVAQAPAFAPLVCGGGGGDGVAGRVAPALGIAWRAVFEHHASEHARCKKLVAATALEVPSEQLRLLESAAGAVRVEDVAEEKQGQITAQTKSAIELLLAVVFWLERSAGAKVARNKRPAERMRALLAEHAPVFYAHYKKRDILLQKQLFGRHD